MKTRVRIINKNFEPFTYAEVGDTGYIDGYVYIENFPVLAIVVLDGKNRLELVEIANLEILKNKKNEANQ